MINQNNQGRVLLRLPNRHYKYKLMLKRRIYPEEAKAYFGISTDKALRKRERSGLKVRKDKGSNRKYYYEEDIIKFTEM